MATAIGSSWTKIVEYTSTATYSVTYRLYAKYSASSIANNTHTIQLKWTTQKTSGGTGVYDKDSTTPKVTNISNGNPTSWTGTAFTIPSGSAVAETDRTTSGNIVVTHNSNGTYSATWSWSLSHVYEGGSKSGTVAVTLPTIPRASSFTLSDSNIYTNQTTTATITRADSSFTHNITTTYSGTSYTLASGVGTSASLSIPTGIRTAMKSANAKSATLTLTLTTLSGSTTIGTATTSLTITVPTATVTVTPASVACNSATTKWTLGNVDTTACTYTVQRLYGSTVRYTDETKSTTTTKSSLANALFEANITSATSGTVTVKVTTYVGTTTVGSNTVTYTVTIPTGTYKPSVTFGSATRTGSTYGNIAYLAGYNGAKATFTTSVNGSSAIDSRSVIITNNITSTSLSHSGSTITVTTGTFPSNSSNYSVTITVTVRDKRGTSASASTTLTISGYAKPSVTATATRANSGGTADTEGTYANLTATGRAHTNASIASMQIKYGSTSVKTATSATVTQNAYGGSFAVANSYTFTAIVTDNLGFSTSISFVLASANYVLSLHPSGGLGIGMVASANRVDSAYPTLRVNSTSAQNQIISGSSTSDKGNSVSAWALSGRIYLVARGTATDDKALVSMNHAGTTNDIIRVNQDNNISEIRPIISNLTHRNHYVIPTVYLNGATAGYYVLCTITVTGTYCDMPFYFRILERGLYTMNGILMFTTTNSGATHSVQVFEADKSYNYLYVYESADNTFQILVRKNGYYQVCLADFQTGSYNTDRCTIDFTTSFLSSLPSGAVQATQTKFVASWADGATIANTATNATNVTVTNTQPTSSTNYYINFDTATSGDLPIRANAGFIYRMAQGSTSAEGHNGLVLGRNIAKGSANNGYGWLRLYGHGTHYYNIYPNETANTDNVTLYMTNQTGTIAIRDATVTGTLTNGSWVTIAYPSGYAKTNCHITGWDVDYNGNYRTGDGLENSATTSRVLISLESGGIKVYTGSSTYNGKTIRVFLSLNA